MNKNENIVIALFSDETAADAAISNLRQWDERVGEVKLGKIGKVTNQDGRIKSELVQSGLLQREFPISKKAIQALGKELAAGQAAVVVKADDFEVEMVADSLKRDGGQVLVDAFERTPEEIAAQKKGIEEAYVEEAVDYLTEKDSRPTSNNVNKAM
ncbi:MAG: hypothetical protein R6X18_14045 [Chloroflexota bacterium]|jgi:hypothetical protein